MKVLEDADLERPVLCESQRLIEGIGLWNESSECPACEYNNSKCKGQHLDVKMPVSPGTGPHGAFHLFYAIHLELGIAGARLIRRVFARRVSEALRCLHIVVISGRRLMDEEWPVKRCTWRRKWVIRVCTLR